METNELPQLDSFCRLCLLQKPVLHPLSSQINTMTIPEMLYKVTGTLLNMHDQLPRVICERCLVKLELAFTTAEEFRKQEELLRRLSWKGALVDELVEFQRSEQSWRKPYSEEVIERLTVVDKTFPLEEIGEVPLEDRLDIGIVKIEPFEASEFCTEDLPDEPFGDKAEHSKWKQQPNEIIDNGLEMVLELEDLRTIGAIPDDLLEQLDMQQISKDESEETLSGGYFIPSSVKSEGVHGDDEVIEDDFDTKDSESEESELEHNVQGYGQFQCKICKKSYESKEELDEHYSSRHKADKKPWKYECKYCQQLFQRKPELAVHEKVHEKRLAAGLPEPNEGPFKCPICKRRYLKVSRYNQHVRRHEHLEKGTFRCKVCDHTFCGLPELRRHERRHETKPEWEMVRDNIPPPILIRKDSKTAFKCAECQHISTNRLKYFQHARRHIIRKTGMFQCQDCGKCYDNKKSLLYHQRTVHNLLTKPESNEKETKISIEPAPLVEIEKRLPYCQECDALFLSQKDYEIHMRVHGANQGPSVNIKSEVTNEDCKESPKDLPSSTPAELNESIPLGSAWICNECGESVTLRTDRTLREHKLMHQRIRNATLKCEVCKIAFSTSVELRRHREAIHGLASGRTLGDREECPLCKKSIKVNVLQKHIKSHENLHLRKHVCSQCNSAYGTLCALRKHVISNKCTEPGYIAWKPEALSKDDIQAFFKWVDKRRSPTGVESSMMIEEQDGLFKCKECDRMFEGFATVAYHTERHKAYVSKEDQNLNAQSMEVKQPSSDSSDLDLLE